MGTTTYATLSCAFMLMGALAITGRLMSESKYMCNSRVLAAAGLMFPGAFLIALGVPRNDQPFGNPSFLSLGMLLGLTGTAIFLHAVIFWLMHVSDKAYLKFYNECTSNKISAFASPKDRQKGELIARKHGLPTRNLEALYAKGKALHGKQTSERADEILQQHQQTDRDEYKRLTEFSKYSGRDKRIAMLTRERADCMETASVLIGGTDALMKASMKKEHVVAINAGIASGIAGGVWGAVTAADTMNKNAAIRAHNEAVKKSFQPAREAAMDTAGAYFHDASRLASAIEAAKTKLVSDDSPEACFRRLSFQKARLTLTKAGSIVVETTVTAPPFQIFDDVNAVVDGSITAEIYDEGKKIGSALLVLPSYGTAEPAKVKGMCLYAGQSEKTYTVKYAAANLWAMEK